MTMICALSYGELAAMMPKAGGQYVYLRESLGPLWGFLYGWTLFLVIQTGTIAAVCVAFGKFLGVFFPTVSSTHWLWHIAHVPAIPVGPMVLGNMEIGVSTANLAGIVVVAVRGGGEHPRREVRRDASERLYRGQGAVACGPDIARIHRRTEQRGDCGKLRQRLERVLAECGLEHAASGAGWRARADRDGESAGDSGSGAGGLAVFGGCVEQRDVYRGRDQESAAQHSAFAGVGNGLCADCYILASAAYILVLPLHGDPHGATVFARGVQYAAEDRIGAAVLQQIFPHVGGYLMAAAILISTFGCANGMTLAGARVYYAMAQDKLFFQSVGKLHPKFKTPAAGLVVQAIWTMLLCVSGSYSQLLDYIIFRGAGFLYSDHSSDCLCCASSSRTRRGRTRRSAIRSCRRSTS